MSTAGIAEPRQTMLLPCAMADGGRRLIAVGSLLQAWLISVVGRRRLRLKCRQQ